MNFYTTSLFFVVVLIYHLFFYFLIVAHSLLLQTTTQNYDNNDKTPYHYYYNYTYYRAWRKKGMGPATVPNFVGVDDVRILLILHTHLWHCDDEQDA